MVGSNRWGNWDLLALLFTLVLRPDRPHIICRSVAGRRIVRIWSEYMTLAICKYGISITTKILVPYLHDRMEIKNLWKIQRRKKRTEYGQRRTGKNFLILLLEYTMNVRLSEHKRFASIISFIVKNGTSNSKLRDRFEGITLTTLSLLFTFQSCNWLMRPLSGSIIRSLFAIP